MALKVKDRFKGRRTKYYVLKGFVSVTAVILQLLQMAVSREEQAEREHSLTWQTSTATRPFARSVTALHPEASESGPRTPGGNLRRKATGRHLSESRGMQTHAPTPTPTPTPT